MVLLPTTLMNSQFTPTSALTVHRSCMAPEVLTLYRLWFILDILFLSRTL